MSTPVTFRKFNEDNSIIALFPTMKESRDGTHIMSYMHEGQHGAAHVSLMSDMDVAMPEEYNKLLTELESIGYGNLVVE